MRIARTIACFRVPSNANVFAVVCRQEILRDNAADGDIVVSTLQAEARWILRAINETK